MRTAMLVLLLLAWTAMGCDDSGGGPDVYQIAAEGWKAETYRILVKDKKGKEKDKGWACDLRAFHCFTMPSLARMAGSW